MKMTPPERLNAVLALLTFAAPAALYSRMSDRFPSHWNARGEVDAYASKPFGPFVIPLVYLALFVIFEILLHLAQHSRRPSKQRALTLLGVSYGFTVIMVTGFVISIAASFDAIGARVPMVEVTGGVFGLILVVVGNYMGKIRQNALIGIRTPWTLADKEVWFRTHRVGGWLFVAGGVVVVVASLLRMNLHLIIGVLIVIAIICMVYSYAVYRRLHS